MEVRARVLAIVRDHPGSETALLAKALGMRRAQIRPYLQQLANDGAIRIEERQVGGMQRRTFVAAEAAELVVNGQSDAGNTSTERTAQTIQ
jgi:predicted ArsR family transcriptional regulator